MKLLIRPPINYLFFGVVTDKMLLSVWLVLLLSHATFPTGTGSEENTNVNNEQNKDKSKTWEVLEGIHMGDGEIHNGAANAETDNKDQGEHADDNASDTKQDDGIGHSGQTNGQATPSSTHDMHGGVKMGEIRHDCDDLQVRFFYILFL